MAKLECTLHGDYDAFLDYIQSGILDKSASASYEDGSDYQCGPVRCAVRVFERYSYTGGNRVSLNLTVVEVENDELFLSAITAGGSQALFFKFNTLGEESFLDTLRELIDQWSE